MGDVADSILEGDFDEETREYIGPGQGFPRSLARERRERRERATKPPEDLVNLVQKKLADNGYIIALTRDIEYGVQLRLKSGGIVNVLASTYS